MLAGGVESMSRVAMQSDGGSWANDPDTVSRRRTSRRASCGPDRDRGGVQPHGRRRLRSAVAGACARRRAEGRFAHSVVAVRDLNDQISSTTTSSSVRARRWTGWQAQAPRSPGWARPAGSTPSRSRSTTGSSRSTTSIRRGTRGHRRRRLAVAIGNEQTGRDMDCSRGRGSFRRRSRGPRRRSCSPGPGPACEKALRKAGISVEDIDLAEINEAFAAVVLRVVRDTGPGPRQGQRQRRRDRHGAPARGERAE